MPTEMYGFFGSKNGDRKYSAEDFSAFFRDFFTNGIVASDTSYLQVRAQNEFDLTIKKGVCYIDGKFFRPSSDLTVVIPESDTVNDRIDIVIIRCDYATRTIYPAVIKGTAAATPERPVIQRNTDKYDLGLAAVYVKANSLILTDADITDLRFDESYCGVLRSNIDHIATSDLFAQYQAAWNDFIAQLSESDNVTINTEDVESRKQIKQIREQLPFGSMFMMV